MDRARSNGPPRLTRRIAIKSVDTVNEQMPGHVTKENNVSNGAVSFGIKPSLSLQKYKRVCSILGTSLLSLTLLARARLSEWSSNYVDLDMELTLPRIERRESPAPCKTGTTSLRSRFNRNAPVGHPRLTCLGNNMKQGCSLELVRDTSSDEANCFLMDSIPISSDSNNIDNHATEEVIQHAPAYYSEEECALADTSYEQLSAATPQTCNEVHSMGLRYTSLSGLPDRGIRDESLTYVSSGGYNSVWRHESPHDRLIMKMHKPSRQFTETDFDRNRRDVLISGLAGRYPNQYHHNVLSVYQYCAYTLVVPHATQPLDDYVRYYSRNNNGQLMKAEEMFQLAFQAARGLYQSHLYLDEKATTAHTDIKPSQFLLFEPPEFHDASEMPTRKKYPLLQLNDFNRCRFLYRSPNNITCPFRICGVKHKGSTYRSPEEYMDCADQKDSIDVFSLGGVFFHLLSDGLSPYYEISEFDSSVKRILKGKLPQLPGTDHYKKYGDEAVDFIRKRANHPAYIVLQKIMHDCWKFEPNDRPSSLDVLKIFEAKAPQVL